MMGKISILYNYRREIGKINCFSLIKCMKINAEKWQVAKNASFYIMEKVALNEKTTRDD